MKRYIGIDVGKAKCRAAIVNDQGDIENEFFFENNPKGIRQLSETLTIEDKVVMESTGNLWLSIYDSLDSMNIKVVLANPMQTKASTKKKKTDKVDARRLALLLKAGLISESYVPPGYLREIRALVRHRLSLVKIRTMEKNKVHAIMDKYGYRYEKSDMYGKAGMEWLGKLKFSEMDQLIINNHISLIEAISSQMGRVDQAILQKASEEEDVRLLLSLSGIDVHTALLIKSEIGSIKRFGSYKNLISWAGLAPSCISLVKLNTMAELQGRDRLFSGGLWWRPPGSLRSMMRNWVVFMSELAVGGGSRGLRLLLLARCLRSFGLC